MGGEITHAIIYVSIPELLQFKNGVSAPVNISKPIDAVSCGDKVYCRGYRSRVIYVYNASTSSWHKLPKCPVKDTSLVILNDIKTNKPTLHTLGGLLLQEGSNDAPLDGHLYCLRQHPSTNEYYWARSPLPPMNKKRKQVTAIHCSNYLLAAGGRGEKGPSQRVEVLNLKTMQWSTVASLPRPVFRASGCICGDALYILGGCMYDTAGNTMNIKYAYKTSLSELIQSRDGDEIFNDVADLHLAASACTTFQDKIFAIGGFMYKNSPGEIKCSNAVYYLEDNSWKKINCSLKKSRCFCFAVALSHPKPQLMIVGGYTSKHDEDCTKSVETAELYIDEPSVSYDLESDKGLSGHCKCHGKREVREKDTDSHLLNQKCT